MVLTAVPQAVFSHPEKIDELDAWGMVVRQPGDGHNVNTCNNFRCREHRDL